MAGLLHNDLFALVYPPAVSGAGPFAPLQACHHQGSASQRVGGEMGDGEDGRRKSTGPDSSVPRFRLTWMVSGGRPDMALKGVSRTLGDVFDDGKARARDVTVPDGTADA